MSDMKGPKRAFVAVLSFSAGSMLAVHLLEPVEPWALEAAPRAAAARGGEAEGSDAAAPPPTAVSRAAPPPVGDGGEAPAPELALASLGVAPVPGPRGERERALGACVERKIRAAGGPKLEPTAPGRWPALKRAREQLRLRRLAARTECEREPAPLR